jgi:transposase
LKPRGIAFRLIEDGDYSSRDIADMPKSLPQEQTRRNLLGEYKRRGIFGQEFKRNAMDLAVGGGRSLREVSGELGLHKNALRRRKSQYLADWEHDIPGKGHMKPHEEELLRLKKRVFNLEQEREIVKKTLAIFSKHSR